MVEKWKYDSNNCLVAQIESDYIWFLRFAQWYQMEILRLNFSLNTLFPPLSLLSPSHTPSSSFSLSPSLCQLHNSLWYKQNHCSLIEKCSVLFPVFRCYEQSCNKHLCPKILIYGTFISWDMELTHILKISP